ncbi:hypothetical protein [Erythrobacter litoralis]|uniref:hypothetical protein n=1 Tax=Erythrobacter litoralis TaxID=39960 RepID=UPI00032287FD|nr:hypothetical protein [Erythrobacter litoralis]
MNARIFVPLLACLALPVSAAQTSDGEDALAAEAQPPEFPQEMWGVYGRNNHACRYRGMDIEGKIGIRGNKIVVEGQPFDLYEIDQVSNRMLVGEFVAPGGWSTSGVRMSFQLLRKNKMWHSTYEGKPAPKIGYVRCNRR